MRRHRAALAHRSDGVVLAEPGIAAAAAGDAQGHVGIAHVGAVVGLAEGQAVRQGERRLIGEPRRLGIHHRLLPAGRGTGGPLRADGARGLAARRILAPAQLLPDGLAEEEVNEQRRHQQNGDDQHGAQQAGSPLAHPVAPLALGALPPAEILLLLTEGAGAVGIGILLPADGARFHSHISYPPKGGGWKLTLYIIKFFPGAVKSFSLFFVFCRRSPCFCGHRLL